MRRTALLLACAGAVLLPLQSIAQLKPLSSFDPQAKALLARMTLDEKIGQMTQPDQSFIKDPADIEHLLPRLAPQRRLLRPQGRQQPRSLDRSLRSPAGAHRARPG